MLIEVPRSLVIWPADGGDLNQMTTYGLNGLGQDPTSDPLADMPLSAPIGSTIDTSGLNLPTASSDPGATTMGGVTASDLDWLFGGTSTSSSTNSTTAQDLAAAAPLLTAASKAMAAATGPYAVPGTSYVYNPSTGQMLLNGAVVGSYNPLTGALTTASSISSYLPLLLGIGAIIVALVMVMGGKK